MKGEYIELTATDGGKFKSYLSLPESGKGPGMVVIQEIFGVNYHIRDVADYYAEEGYVVLAPDLFWRMEPEVELGYSEDDFQKAFGYYQQLDVDQCIKDIGDSIKALRSLPQLEGQVGCIGFCLGGKLAYLTAARTDVDCAVGYYGVAIETSLDEANNISCPLVLHFAGEDQFVPPEAVKQITAKLGDKSGIEIYNYPGTDHAFNCPERPSYHKPSAMMAHSRSMAMFRKVLGPAYDLSALWDKHCEYEFATRDVDATMATMVAEPYVNHIPTMTGGVGAKHLHRFYRNHFVNANPEDTELIPISRTIGADRIVDEMLFCFTHTMEVDWMLPGIPPTGKRVEIPLVAIVNFRGDKLYHEHIYWDQASVLVQLGLLDPSKFPVAGQETAKKLLDEALPSNTLMKRWAESESA
jgi:carboxymethylenebutenolidase